MKAIVIFESMFGNTQKVAEAVARGLSIGMQVDLLEVGAAPDHIGDETNLIVVGAPTHAFGLSREGTRSQAAQQAGSGLVSKGRGVREWLAELPKPTVTVAAASFDTRLAKPAWLKTAGTAGRAIEKRLRRLGLRTLAHAESFVVGDVAGPLAAGELERARQWGQSLASQFSSMDPKAQKS